MAISGTLCRLLRTIKPMLPRGGTLLEIGEANWYGEVDADFPCRDRSDLFAIAKDFYLDLFAPSEIVSVDATGTKDALPLDLNGPLQLSEQFDIAINHGTAEHVFNISQVFRTMHDWTVKGGLMIHESPMHGWVDHGFYCLQPTLFYDVAAANCYEIAMVAVEDIYGGDIIRIEHRDQIAELARDGVLPANAMLFVVFRKIADGPFKIPMQGYYAKALSPKGVRAWKELR